MMLTELMVQQGLLFLREVVELAAAVVKAVFQVNLVVMVLMAPMVAILPAAAAAVVDLVDMLMQLLQVLVGQEETEVLAAAVVAAL